MIRNLTKEIFRIKDDSRFRELTLEIFRYQAVHNKVYHKYITLLGIPPAGVDTIEKIPFLPVSLFRKYPVVSFNEDPEEIFVSSSTTAEVPSRHYIRDLSLYEESFLRTFRMFYGDPGSMIILALLPSYLERSGSSLIYMVNRLIQLTKSPHSGFNLHDHEKLYEHLQVLSAANRKILFFGVSYALLDFAEKYEISVPGLIVMETGGMKGRRKEMVREELHGILKKRFHVSTIHSEYGMTEMLTQAYSHGGGVYTAPPWMKIMIRDPYDPFSILPHGRHGGINVLDLANIYSCAFLETGDLGVVYPNGTFSVSGRFDHSALRGCNLMVQDI